MFITDIIKIKYSDEGYLPDYPPHLISDEEMCEAFLNTHTYSYFYDHYELLTNDLYYEYEELINALKFHLCRFLSKVEVWKSDLPDWVYSYMLGEVVGDHSVIQDRHYFLVGIGRDNIDDVMTPESQKACYEMSRKYVNKIPKQDKYMIMDEILKEYDDDVKAKILKEFEEFGVKFDDISRILYRPPSMFGEQNIIKLIRLSEVGQ